MPADIATIYRCRWAIELLFRELKTLYDLDEFDTSNPAVVEILLYAAVLTLLVSRELLELVIDHADAEAVFPPVTLGVRLEGRRPADPQATQHLP